MSSSPVAVAAVLASALAPAARAQTSDEQASQATTATSPPASEDSQPRSRLPFLADEARKRGYELPLPYGAAFVITRLGGRKIQVDDLRIGINDEPAQSVSDFADLGSTSDVFNANLKFDAWLLPFLSVYALVGYVHNESDTHLQVTLPKPGPIPGEIQVDKRVPTSLDGVVGGVGMTLAGGHGPFFVVVDANYIQSDLGFDDRFDALIATLRAGWNGKLNDTPVQLWLGAGNWDTAATAKGHVKIDDETTLRFEADQRPKSYWMYDVGSQIEFSKRWQLVLDLGFDFDGGYVAVIGPTYRYGN
jgi:hypothetical protein